MPTYKYSDDVLKQLKKILSNKAAQESLDFAQRSVGGNGLDVEDIISFNNIRNSSLDPNEDFFAIMDRLDNK